MSKRKTFKHITKSDRREIKILLDKGYNQVDIAKSITCDPSSLSREIKVGMKDGKYCPDKANHARGVRRSNSKYQGKKIEQNKELKEYIIKELKRYRSPDEIAGRMKKETLMSVSKNAIYAWLYSPYGVKYSKYLCTKRYKKKKQKKKTKRDMIPERIPLKQRPDHGEHAEVDLFVSKRKHSTSRSGAITCISSSQLLIGSMINDRRPSTMVIAVNEMIKDKKIDDLTLDNGIENRYHKDFNLPAYFADPHSPWQKPHVENNIGLLRKWCIPKNTDLNTVSDDILQQSLHFLNLKYRRSLGYKNSYELSIESGIIKDIPDIEINYDDIIK